MAHLQRRRPESALTARQVGIALFALLTGPGIARAQREDPSPPGRVARMTLDVGVRVTSLNDEAATLTGGAVTFSLGGPVEFGGGGWILVDDVAVEGGSIGSDLQLQLGYAGALVRVPFRLGDGVSLRLGALAGAGHAAVPVPVVDAEIPADNFLVLEPALSFDYILHAWIGGQATLAYRFVAGVEDLLRIRRRDLSGFSAGISLSFGPL